MTLKLHFIVPDEFFRLHPQLTEEDRKAVMALNNPESDWALKNPEKSQFTFSDGTSVSVDIFENAGFQILDPDELKAFFKMDENANGSDFDYKTINYYASKHSPFSAKWQGTFAKFLLSHLHEDELKTLVDSFGFPVLDTKKLGENPAENMDLFLDRLIKQAKMYEKLSYSYILENRGPFKIDVEKNNFISTQEEHFSLIITPLSNPLFWAFIDPKNQDPHLKFRFFYVLDKITRKYNQKYINEVNSKIGINMPSQMVINADNFVNLIRDVKSELKKEIDLSLIQNNSHILNKDQKIKEAGFVLIENKRAEFETFLTGDSFKKYYGKFINMDDRDPWPQGVCSEFLSFFGKDGEGFEIKGSSWGSIELTKNKESYKLDDILHAQGYHVFNHENEVIFTCRIIEENIVHQNISGNDYSYLVDQEPLDLKLFYQLYSHSLNYSIDDSLIPTLARTNFLEFIKTVSPWMSPLVDQMGEDGNQHLEEAAKQINKYESLYSDKVTLAVLDLSPEMAKVLAYLRVLRESAHPKAVLLLMIWRAENSGAENSCESILLQHLCSQIMYDVHRGEIINDDILVELQVIANNWAIWDSSILEKVVQRISDHSDDQLKEIIDNIDIASFDTVKKFVDEHTRFEKKTNFEPGKNEFELSIPEPIKGELLSLKRLNKFIKFDSTWEKIHNHHHYHHDQKGSEISLIELTRLSGLTGTERADVKRALQKYFQFYSKERIGKFNFESDNNQDQLEILPDRVIEALIEYGYSEDRSSLWRAFFRKNEEKAFELYEQALLILSENPDLKKYYTFPNADDIKLAYSYVLISSNPQTKEITKKYESLLKECGVNPDYLDIKNGKISYLDYYLKDLNQRESIDIWKTFEELDRFFKNYVTLYKTYDGAYVDSNLKGILPEYVLNYIHFKYNPDYLNQKGVSTQDVTGIFINEWKKRLESIEESDLDADDSQKIDEVNDEQFALGFWQTISSDSSLKENETILKNYFEALDLALLKGKIHGEDIKEILDDIKNKSNLKNREYPQTIYILSIAFGHDWAKNKIKKEILLKTVKSALTKESVNVLQPDHQYTVFFQHLSFSKSGHISTAIIHLMSFVRAQWGEFYCTPSSDNPKMVFFGSFDVYSKWLDGDSSEKIQFKNYSILKDFDPTHPTMMKIRNNLRSASENGIEVADEELDGLIVNAVEKFMYPEKSLLADLEFLVQFDAVDYPKNPFSYDKSKLELDEIISYQKEIEERYESFGEDIQLLIDLKRRGYKVDLNQTKYFELTNKQNLSPWALYALNLFGALFGDKNAIDELFKYHENEKKLEAKIHPFSKVCDELLDVGKKVLIEIDANRFFYKTALAEVDDNTLLGMIEFEHPDPSNKILQGHLQNPHFLTEDENPKDRSHPTIVAQTALGNPPSNAEAKGIIVSYVINLDGNDFWVEIENAFRQILIAAESGFSPRGFNLSFGTSTGRIVGNDFETLANSPRFLNLQQVVASILYDYNILIFLSAGNSGEMIDEIQAEGSMPLSVDFLSELNFLSTLDPGLIVVGSTPKKPEKDEPKKQITSGDPYSHFGLPGRIQAPDKEVSTFSSEGNIYIHPDFVTNGEGYTFIGPDGLEVDVDGTSFSSPNAMRLGVAMVEINPDLTVEMFHAISKMTAIDTPSHPEKEGAGKLQSEPSLYLAHRFAKGVGKKENKKYAEKLGLNREEQKQLNWMGRRIKWQTFFGDATKQSFGE